MARWYRPECSIPTLGDKHDSDTTCGRNTEWTPERIFRRRLRRHVNRQRQWRRGVSDKGRAERNGWPAKGSRTGRPTDLSYTSQSPPRSPLLGWATLARSFESYRTHDSTHEDDIHPCYPLGLPTQPAHYPLCISPLLCRLHLSL